MPSNPMLAAEVSAALKYLAKAHPGARRDVASPDTIAIYADALEGVALAAVQAAPKRCVQLHKFFPSPAELREVAELVEREQREARVAAFRSPDVARDPRLCPDCRTRYEFRALYVPRGLPTGVNEQGRKLYATEVVERMLCECRREREQEVLDNSPSWEDVRSRWADARPARGIPRQRPSGVSTVGEVLGALPGVEPMAPSPERRDGPPDAWEREPEPEEDAA